PEGRRLHGGARTSRSNTALRFCLSDLVIMKHVPARTCTARELGLDLGEQTLNTKGAALHGWLVLSRAAFVLSRATRFSCREEAARSTPIALRIKACPPFFSLESLLLPFRNLEGSVRSRGMRELRAL